MASIPAVRLTAQNLGDIVTVGDGVTFIKGALRALDISQTSSLMALDLEVADVVYTVQVAKNDAVEVDSD